MVFEDFSWFPVLPHADVGDNLQLGADGDCYASVLATGQHDEWIATVNLHQPVSQHRSATFESKGEARAAVHEWLRVALHPASLS